MVDVEFLNNLERISKNDVVLVGRHRRGRDRFDLVVVIQRQATVVSVQRTR